MLVLAVPALVLDPVLVLEPALEPVLVLELELVLEFCVTVTFTGLPVAPVAVTAIVAVRSDVSVFAEKLHVRVPGLQAADVQLSQLLLGVTAVVQGMFPSSVLATVNGVVPAAAVTLWLSGVTDSTEGVDRVVDVEKIVPKSLLPP